MVKTASGCDVGSVCWNETLTLIAVNQATAMSKGLESKSKNHASDLVCKLYLHLFLWPSFFPYFSLASQTLSVPQRRSLSIRMRHAEAY